MLHAPITEHTKESGGKGKPPEPTQYRSAPRTLVPGHQVAAPRPQGLGLRPSQGGLLRRKCACGGTPGPTGECAGCRAKRFGLQRQAADQPEPSTVPPIVHEVLRLPGQSLDANTRAFMEPRFGHDFSRVRVHTDVRAVESAKAMNALAYTVGQDVVFGPGQYVPGTVEGKRLLAHELTHTMQQGIQSPNISGLKLAAANDAPEQEARRAENQFVAGNSSSRIGVAPVQTSVQRACGPKEIGEVSGCIGRDGDVSDFGSTGEDLFLFQVDCDLFQPGEKARLEEYAREIGPEEIVAIDGFASEEGMPEFNERLSCARAHAAASILFTAGVPPSQVEIYMHGATPGRRDVRRSVMITVIPASPEPMPEPEKTPEATQTRREKLIVWINAFIPGDISGVTKTVPEGSFKGQTMLEAPWPFDCFLTDNRTFSSQPDAKSRMRQGLVIDLDSMTVSGHYGYSDPTTGIDCETGTTTCTDIGDPSKIKYQIKEKTTDMLIVYIEGAGKNPCIRIRGVVPYIDYKGHILIDKSSNRRSVAFLGYVDEFPAFEMYAVSTVQGTPRTIFASMPPKGNTPGDLLGPAILGRKGFVTF